MPSIVRRTASPPLCAMSTECRATSAERSALPDTSSIDAAIAAIDSEAEAICFDWRRRRPWRGASTMACVWRVAASSLIAESLIVVTSSRSASIA